MNKDLPEKIAAGANSVYKNLQAVIKKLGWQLACGFLAAIAAAIFFGWLASEIFEGETQGFDESIRRAVHQTASPFLTSIMIFFTYLGSVWGIILLLIITSGIFIHRQNGRSAVILWLTMVGEVVLGIVLKYSFARPRPNPFFDFPLPSSYSFPSGHAFASLCFFGVTAWLITSQIRNSVTKVITWVLAAILILMIGISRIYLGVHFPSDVIAGYAAGLIWLVTVIFADWWRHDRKSRIQKTSK